MNETFLTPIRSKWAVSTFLMIGFLFNSLLHLYRFQKVGWTHVTGLVGNNQLITWSFLMAFWVIIPFCLTKFLDSSMRRWWPNIFIFCLLFIVLNQVPGRSVLKMLFDVILVGIFLGWFMIDIYYGGFLSAPPSEKAFSFVVSELIIFQTSLAILTFVIAIFGFSFAPNYIQKYYSLDIGQPTVWWFTVLTTYLSLGVLAFICVHAWLIAIKLRSIL